MMAASLYLRSQSKEMLSVSIDPFNDEESFVFDKTSADDQKSNSIEDEDPFAECETRPEHKFDDDSTYTG